VRVIRLDLGFAGTRYEGWQSQGRGRTVQEVLEKALKPICGHAVSVIGCSRTDAGVHAAHYVASFRTKSAIPDATLVRALNFHLPEDIVVSRARTVKPSFHARFSAKSKVYRYRIWESPVRPLFEAPYMLWFPYGRLDIPRMRRAARCLPGRHDFRAFVDQGGEAHSTVRTVRSVRIRKSGREIQIEVEGDGFLKHMVRVLVGTLLEVGRGKEQADFVEKALIAKSRSKAGPTAKALGLTLLKVRF
jgi:tRNA pseudouridine38-40 synthase